MRSRGRTILTSAVLASCGLTLLSCGDDDKTKLQLDADGDAVFEPDTADSVIFGDADATATETTAPDGTTSDGTLSDTTTPDDTAAETAEDAASDVGPGACDDEPGGFGCPCGDNDECNSGFCLPARDGGKICTKYCTTDCPDGYDCSLIQFPGSDPTFLCLELGLNLCRPCTSDAQCQTGPLGSTSDRCVQGAGRDGSFCGIACGETGDYCPTGYECETVTALEGGAEFEQCVPAAGAACECSGRAIAEDAWTACADETCLGTRVCSLAGLSACDARPWSAEACDGIDNDCDADVDEGSADTDGDRSADCVDSDDDGDGIADGDDNCPLIANASQANHDTDADGDACDADDDDDGIGDADDNCPLLENVDQHDSDDDGVGDRCDDGLPDAPTIEASDPGSPSPDASPILTGSAERGSTVTIYADALCEGDAVGVALTDLSGTFSGEVAVPANVTSVLHATATDGAGNISPCSSAPFVYTHDDIAPAAPQLVSTDPASPTRSDVSPILEGLADSDEEALTVRLYIGSSCAGTPVETTAVAPDGSFTIAVSVSANTQTTFVADAIDAAGNVSACSDPLAYLHDDMAPAPPTWSGTTPASPSNTSTTPTLNGFAESNTTVRVYVTAGCGGSVIASASAPAGTFAAAATASANATTTFYATATDVAGNTSLCSGPLAYTHNALVPDPPVITSSNPASPSNASTTPTLAGTSKAGSVKVYADASCGGSAVATVGAGAQQTFSAQVSATSNASTAFTATVTDAAGNTSACSAPYHYVHDDRAPPAPVLDHTDPVSPSAVSLAPMIFGTAEATTTVTLYARAGCTGAPAATAVAGSDNGFALSGPAAANATTEFSATARDEAGNVSPCSAAIAYTHDNKGPNAPVLTGTTPTSPSSTVTLPTVAGDCEAGAIVRLYANATCAGNPVATTDASAAGDFSAPAPAGENTTTQYSATATDAAGLTSGCSAPLAYTHDNIAPAIPVITASEPASPSSGSVAPVLSGTTDPATTVELYAVANCAGAPLAAGASIGSTFAISGSLAANSTRTFYARAVDAADNISGCSAGFSYTHDNDAPAIPVLTGTTPASPSNQTTSPFLDGYADAGMTIKVFTNAQCSGAAVATLPANPGTFSIPVSATANDATTWYANATDAAQNVSGCSTGRTFVHDTAAPAAPVLTSFTPGSISRLTASPNLHGTIEKDATLTIYAHATCNAQAQVLATLPLSPATFDVLLTLAENTTTIVSATATDLAGNTSPCSNSLGFTHDDRKPDVPVIVASDPESPSKDDLTPQLSGTSEAGTIVHIFTNSTCTSAVVGSDVVGNGGFSAQVDAANNGTRTFYASATDAAGNESSCSAGFSYTHDAQKPAAPTWTPTDPTSPSRTSTAPKLNGGAETDATVTIYAGNACGGAALTTTSAAASVFAVTVTAGANQPTTWTATATDEAGNVSDCSVPVTYVHDSLAPAAPNLTSTTPTSPSNTNLNPIINGTAEVGVTVRLYTNPTCTDPSIGSPQVAAAGAGDFSIGGNAAANTQTTFYAKATDPAGNPSPCSAGIAYLHDSLGADGPPIITHSAPATPNKSSTTPTLHGTAEAGSTVTLYKDSACGGTTFGSGPATGGAFAIATSAGTNQPTTFYAKSVDAANNPSPCSIGFVYVHDTDPPTAPTLTGSNPGSPGKSTSPGILGTATAGTTVQLYTSSACTSAIGNATGTSGSFEIVVGVSAPSTTTFYATATDAAGNTSACSSGYQYICDTAPPNAPAWTGTNPASPSNSDTTPQLEGTSEVGATIQIYAQANCAGAIIASVPALAGTSFSKEVTVGDNTTNTYSATATDAAGNTSGCSASLTYIHDSGKPPTPVLTGTTPSSPSKTNGAPSVNGTTGETGVTIDLFHNGTCNGAAVKSISNATSPFAISTTVTVNVPVTFTVRSRDAAQNLSGCSNAIGYLYDTEPPATPTITASDPVSPSRTSTTPKLAGSAETGALVEIFTLATCTGTVSGSGSAVGGNLFANIQVSAVANNTTIFYARATDPAGNPSLCSAGFSYQHDSQGPTGLVLTGFNPGSPSRDVATAVLGTIPEAGLAINLYKTADCTGAVVATRTNAATSFSINASANANTETFFSAIALDGSNNPSACSNALTYVHDNIAPLKPVITGSDPGTPSNASTSPKIQGTTSEPDLTIRIYDNAACAEPYLTFGTTTPAGATGTFSIASSAAANQTTGFKAKAIDAAGNASTCSDLYNYIHDSIAPPAPVLSVFIPASPSTTTTGALVRGTEADATSKVYLYPSTNCSGSAVNPSGTTAGAQFDISFTATNLGCTPVSARAIDLAGNPSLCSSSLTFAHYGCPQCLCTSADWVRQFGSNTGDGGAMVAVDQSGGSVYIAGNTSAGVLGQTPFGDLDGFLVKYSTTPGPAQLVRAIQIGTSAWDVIQAVAMDDSGNVYVAGSTEGNIDSSATPPVICADQGGATLCPDAFIAKYNSAGARQWINRYPNTRRDTVADMAWDGPRNRMMVFVTSANIPNANGQSPIVLSVNGTSGAIAVFWSYIDDSLNDSATGIAVDASGNVYIQGRSQSTLPHTPVVSLTNGAFGNGVIYLFKLSAAGGVTWLTHWGSPGHDISYDLVVDTNGDVYATGFVQGVPDGNGNAGQLFRGADGTDFGGWGDAAVVKLNSSGVQQWIRTTGTSRDDLTSGIGLGSGRVWVAGMTKGNVITGATTSLYGGTDLFLASWNTDGTVPASSLRMHGTAGDDSLGRAQLSSGIRYLPGSSSQDWTGMSRDMCTFAGGTTDAFLARFCTSTGGGPPSL